MARSTLALALCFTFAVPFVWSRRVSNGNKIASADVAQQPQGSTIFVIGFNHNTDEEAVKKHFGAVGAIKELHFQGRGAAVITYKKSSAATRAVNELHETSLEGQSRSVVVKMDDPDRESKGDKGNGKDKGKTNGKDKDKDNGNKMASADVAQQPQGSTIFVNGFNFGTEEEAVKKHFGAVGAIKELHFQGRGGAVITYKKSSAATRAVNQLHETTLEGQSRYVVVKMDDPDRESKGDKGKGEVKDKGKTKDSGKVGSRPPGRTVFVIGFDFGSVKASNHDALMNHFGTVGAIEDHHFQSRRSAVITYVKASSAKRAITDLDGSIMSGQTRYMEVKLDEPDQNGGEQSESSPPAKGSGNKRKVKGEQ